MSESNESNMRLHSIRASVADRQPIPGTSWRVKTEHNGETRHVVDRKFDGTVVYFRGKMRTFGVKLECTFTEWEIWSRRAVQIERKPTKSNFKTKSQRRGLSRFVTSDS